MTDSNAADGGGTRREGAMIDIGAGKQIEQVTAFADVTERKQAEARLAAPEAEPHSARAMLERTAYEVTENIPVGTYTMVLPPGAAMAHFSFMSERFLALTGLDRATAAADPLQAFACVHPDDHEDWVRLNAEAFANKRPFFGETRLLRQGEVRWITAESRPRDLPDGSTVWEGVLIDITERKRVEIALTEARAAAEAANRAKSAFLAHMSHEIRNPMNAIVGLSELALRRVAPLDPVTRGDLEQIHRSVRNLLGILDDILDQSKIEAGRLTLDPAPFALADLLADVRNLFAATAAERGLALILDADPALPAWAVGDVLRLRQVLSNLLGNALKFTEQGQVRLAIAVLEADGASARLRWTVEDTGMGMDEATQARLFAPFAQGDDSITRRFGGTGLGLSISRALVELMGGRLDLDSAPGRGSRFRFELTLPVAAAPADAGQAPTAAGDLRGARILVAEDQPLNRRVIAEMLTLLGIESTLAEDGQSALERLAEHPAAFDAVLLDIQMPVLDGLSVARRLRADPRWAELPAIALTGGVTPEERQRIEAAGMNDLIAKPVTLDALAAALGRWLAGRAKSESGGARPEPEPAAMAPAAGSDAPELALPGFDLDQLLTFLDRADVLDLLRQFAQETGGLPETLADALAAGRFGQARAETHRLKGVAANIGAVAVAGAAARLEKTLHEDRHDPDLLETLRRTHADALAVIAALDPALPTVPSAGRDAGLAAETANGRGAGARLLIVDDAPLAVETLGRVLADMGELTAAASGAEALELVARTPFDLILLDAVMPGMDGFETCRILRRDHPEIPIIFVTAANDFDSEVRALQAGALDFIVKPINPPVVRARVGVYLQLKAQSDRLRFLASTDRLTGICNRLSFETRAAEEIGRGQRYGMPLSLILFDIDRFKSINDRFGHLVGDRVLVEVARRVGRHLRAADALARWGGEEFTVMMPHCGLPEAIKLAEKLRVLIAGTPFADVGPVTSSFGVAEWAAGENLDQWVKRADAALYAAKEGGRNRVETG